MKQSVASAIDASIQLAAGLMMLVVFAFVVLTLTCRLAGAAEFTEAQRAALGVEIRNYLLAHPEVLEETAAELGRRRAEAEAVQHRAAVAENGDAIFNSPRGVVVGGAGGDVTFVEFFDYNCGYCKRAMVDMFDLMKTDPKVKVVLKELPVLGAGSVEAAKVAIAVRMQAPGKYLDFHQKLLGGRGQADKSRALAAAGEVGLDVARIAKDMDDPEVQATLDESFRLARSLGLTGTPSYVVGKDVVVGAVGLPALREKINLARCGKDKC